jgi:hypothetical protein
MRDGLEHWRWLKEQAFDLLTALKCFRIDRLACEAAF